MIIRESLLDHSNSRQTPPLPRKFIVPLLRFPDEIISTNGLDATESRAKKVVRSSATGCRCYFSLSKWIETESVAQVSVSPLISFAERLRKRVAPKKKRNSRMQFRFHPSIDKAESFDFTGRWLSSIGHIGLYDSILFRSNLSRFDSSFPLHLQVVSIRGSDSRFPASDPFDLFIIRNWSYAAQRRDLSPLPWRGEKKEKERTAHAVNR